MKSIRLAAVVVATVPCRSSTADVAGAGIVNVEGAATGKAVFEQTPPGVLMTVDVAGLSPSPPSIHLQAVGSCIPVSKGHVNPGKRLPVDSEGAT